MRILLMRFDAPLLSFGGTVVDANNVTDEMPSRAMVTGLLGNALGWDRRDTEALGALQTRILLGARRDVAGEEIVDFHTVDLGQDFMLQGWTTRGRVEGREGGTAATGTHIRKRHYLADAIYTVAVALEPPADHPDVDALAAALSEPARPLFLGRKACLPSTEVFQALVEADSLFTALTAFKLEQRARKGESSRSCLIRVPDGTVLPVEAKLGQRAITEDRDWLNQIHVGRRFVLEGFVDCGERGGDT